MERTLGDIGEFALIRELRGRLSAGPGTLVGIGDDAAVLEPPAPGRVLLFTTDMLVEGTHFDLAAASPYRIGWKALACSLSDIAAMGGVPRAAVVSLGAPGGLGVDFCRELYRGMDEAARRFDCGIAGGDTVGSSRGLAVSVAMLGDVERERLVLRSGARTGDGLWVTGWLGGSLAGKHLAFTPRVHEARFLVERFPVTAMMDLSDGLGSDLFRMAEASEAGFRLCAGRIPVDRAAIGDADEETLLRRALYDGEDFELLAAVAPSVDDAVVKEAFDARFDCGIRRIGTVMGKAHGITLSTPEGERPLIEGGFAHLA
ncbi:MAG: thiamine-phosphate kinase [Chlamydiae bacterium]|nr:thiamine-phosphate kinase [Chlamydiota bacterium]HQM51637.1 thiamine-phosphate kinase [bacterium]